MEELVMVSNVLHILIFVLENIHIHAT